MTAAEGTPGARRPWWRLGAALVGGLLLYLAFPPLGWWLLTPVALGILYACLVVGRPSVRVGAVTGFVFGLGFFVPLLPWIGEFVGPLPWLALAVVCAVYLALFGAMATVTGRVSAAAPVAFALVWVGVEWFRSSFPFGGFPWGAAAFSQTRGFFLPVARWVGVPGLSFVLALTGASVAALLITIVTRRREDLRRAGDTPEEKARELRWGGRTIRLTGAVVVAAAAAVFALAAAGIATVTAPSPNDGPTLRVAVVQGNVPRLGLDFNAQRRAVLDNHFRETVRLAEDIAAGKRARPDLILWPENASDISPLDNADAARIVSAAVTATGVPIVFGTVLPGDPGPSNTVLVWEADDGVAAPAPTGRYDKHIIQPFGEYLPWRSFFAKFSSYADQAGNFQAGTGPAVVQVPTAAGTVPVGVSTCWEVAFDRSPRQAARDGGQLVFVPTNNATFGHTDMTYQQLAMSQVRAVETGRSVAVAATSGISALLTPDGRAITSSEIFTPSILEADLPLRTDQTLAVRLGPWPQAVMVVGALAAFLFALGRRTRFYTLFSIRDSAAEEGAHDR
ncbi:apolipoprotein N-acyltransferase [Gordonia hirsuta DSM 44140 = NBRC 16056]|uniref:Apolipoprotein N-acyltransferase n=1 Tax=Gordonia hirsuta DSM 44140 = NBRC 16056 TaxID=1121927 RepID=L7L7X5_9ACTN|nr:apolipoprotein N-acyltransferase [Gordonia hirsuta]GAC56123.1 apolipoprotein N-acyltransferase [Gordonia hirsuta DSM 44140 = NBRC 16056]